MTNYVIQTSDKTLWHINISVGPEQGYFKNYSWELPNIFNSTELVKYILTQLYIGKLHNHQKECVDMERCPKKVVNLRNRYLVCPNCVKKSKLSNMQIYVCICTHVKNKKWLNVTSSAKDNYQLRTYKCLQHSQSEVLIKQYPYNLDFRFMDYQSEVSYENIKAQSRLFS